MHVSIWTALIVLAVGIYDIAYAFNRRKSSNNRLKMRAFVFLGIIFLIGGIIMLIIQL